MMTDPVKALFQPFTLGNLELPTRVVMAPMTRSFSPGGVPNSKVIEYYRRRAAAGVGLIVTEGTTVGHKAANGYPNVPRFYGADALAGWKKVVEAVHAEGGKIVPQLWHVGNVRKLGTEPDASVPGYGPSEKIKEGNVVVHGMTQDDINAAFALCHRTDPGRARRSRPGVPDHLPLLAMEAAGLQRPSGGNPGSPGSLPQAAERRRRGYLPLLDSSLLGA